MMNTHLPRVQGETAPARPESSGAGVPGSTAALAAKKALAAETPTIEFDPRTHQPVAVRFPWLSRLTAALAAVSTHHWPFKSVPVTGENVDGSA
jgi:hypothetical protein